MKTTDRIRVSKPQSDESMRIRLTGIIAQMREYPWRETSTEALAEELHVTAGTFIRRFRTLTGVSPLRFLSAVRMDLAKRLLINTKDPITQIAFDCGYQSLGTFVRTFTDSVGLSPMSFRAHAAEGMDFGSLAVARAIYTQPTANGILGTAIDPDPERAMLVAVGVFSQAVPSRPPTAGCLLLNGGRFSISDELRHGERYVLGFAIPLEHSLWSIPLNEALVAKQRLVRYSDEILSVGTLQFERPLLTDPPIVIALPALFQR